MKYVGEKPTNKLNWEVMFMKKYIAEAIGTCVLVTLGCGTAMLVGCNAAQGSGYL